MMTRKHYIEIAKILAVGASAATNESERTIVNNMTDDFIAMLKRDNQSFSAEKFRAYIEKCMWA